MFLRDLTKSYLLLNLLKSENNLSTYIYINNATGLNLRTRILQVKFRKN